MIFTLPNGLHAYFITNNRNLRLDEAPIEIVDDARGNQIVNGDSCMGCHANGIIEFENELPVIGSYSSEYQIFMSIQEDNTKYWNAMNQIAYPEQTYAAPQQPTFVTNAALGNNYPNPFNPETWIPYELDEPTNVTIEIHNVNGQLVRSLDLGHQQSNHYTAHWNGKNEIGERVASGVYFYTLITKNFIATRKMVIMK